MGSHARTQSKRCTRSGIGENSEVFRRRSEERGPQLRLRGYSVLTKRKLSYYQTMHWFARTIFAPGLHWNASENSFRFDSGPLTRYSGGECGSVVTRMRAIASRRLPHHACAIPRKKSCSSVNLPTLAGGFDLR